jgi:hypothetical protein
MLNFLNGKKNGTIFLPEQVAVALSRRAKAEEAVQEGPLQRQLGQTL